MNKKLTALALSVMVTSALLAPSAYAQQVADTSFAPPIPAPAYRTGRGPVVMLDEAHFNFHTAEGRYKPFAELLRRDGYVVRASRLKFSKASLRGGRILVIANPLAERNRTDWSLPTPSAFSRDEVRAVREWVRGGGSLLLIADHMPFPGAAGTLAQAFGVRFSNGYAVDEKRQGPMLFKLSDGSLKEHPITTGRGGGRTNHLGGDFHRLGVPGGRGRAAVTYPGPVGLILSDFRGRADYEGDAPLPRGRLVPGRGHTVREGARVRVRGGGDVLGAARGAEPRPDGDERPGRGTKPSVLTERHALALRQIKVVRPK